MSDQPTGHLEVYVLITCPPEHGKRDWRYTRAGVYAGYNLTEVAAGRIVAEMRSKNPGLPIDAEWSGPVKL